MSLKLSLEIIFVVKDDTLIGDRDEYFFAISVGQVMNSIVDVVVESECPLQLEGRRLPQIFFLTIVLLHQLVTNIAR